MNTVLINFGIVRDVENQYTKDGCDGLRIKAEIALDKARHVDDIPWAFPLLPKMFQTAPKIGEQVLVIFDKTGNINAQRFYIGPIISQPQYMAFCDNKDATTLLDNHKRLPIAASSNEPRTHGAFPKETDVAVAPHSDN